VSAVTEAIARADAIMAPALELYAERNKLAALYYRLPLRDLVRLNQLIAQLSEEDLRRVVAFAEGLVAWGADASQETTQAGG